MLASIIFLAAAFFSPQVDEDKIGTGCEYCENRGVEICGRHDKHLFPLEEQVLYCSVAHDCKDCSGALLIDCVRCSGGPDNILLEQRLLRFENYAAAPTAPEKLLERPLTRIVTEHFDILIDVKKVKDGSRKLSGHQLAHAMAVDLEKAAALLNKHFKAGPHNNSNRTRIWYWSDLKDHRRVNQEILKQHSDQGYSVYGVSPVTSSWTGAKGLGNKALNIVSNAVHKATHLRFSNLFRSEWIGDNKAGWFDVGAAHWYEDKVFQRISTYCIDEANTDLDYEGGKWHVAMRRYLVKHKESLLPELLKQISGTLKEEQHAVAWCLYDWVATEHPESLQEFLMGFKNRKESRELFRDLLGMSVLEAEVAWRTWVAATYPAKDPKPRKKL